MGKRPLYDPYKPCPCGSGKKYKFCCFRSGADPKEKLEGVHGLDGDLVMRILRYAKDRFPESGRPDDDFEDRMGGDPEDPAFWAPWAAYHRTLRGRAVVEWFLEERGKDLTPAERAWLEAQRRAWLSIWEATEVVPGESLALLDLLTGETRRVVEKTGSRMIRKGMALLGRVVDGENGSLLCGIHQHPLPPDLVPHVLQEFRSELGIEARTVPVELLKEEETMATLIAFWEDEVEDMTAAASTPPRLQNTDGDKMVLTKDTFEIDAGKAGDATARLLALEGAERESDEAIVFLRSGQDRTVIGRAAVAATSLVLETNSTKRADALRRRVEEACPGLLRHVKRKAQTAASLMESLPKKAPREPKPHSAQELAILKKFKEQHYEKWLDDTLPALGGMTPREAAKGGVGRELLLQLLKEIEYGESGLPEKERYDFSKTRRSLGL